MGFARQVWTLTVKNLLLTLVRPYLTTPFRAFLLPVIFIAFLSYARNLFVPPAEYGIGAATPVRSIPEALSGASGGRNKVVFVNNGFTGGDIERVITQVAAPVRESGKIVEIISSPDTLSDACRSTLRGTSPCVVAGVFYSSPSEGPDKRWNYTIKADGSLGGFKIRADATDNDAQIYVLPFQHAVDWAIASLNDTVKESVLDQEIMEYPFTSKTAKEREDEIRERYTGSIMDFLGVAIFIGMVGVTYQLTGLVAAERELGMSQLIDCMIPSRAPWIPQAVRFLAAHLALDMIYAPGWIVMAIILQFGVYSKTSHGIMIIYHLLAGMALSSFSLFGASFFKRSQLSGITAVIVCLLLGVVAQVVGPESNAGVGILTFLFPPMNYVYFVVFMARWERQALPTNLVKAAPESPWTIPGIVFWVFLIVQIVVYPILAGVMERLLYGTQSKGRTITTSGTTSAAVSLTNFTKIYPVNWFYRNIGRFFGSRRQPVVAVNDLTLDVTKGEIMVLLGANGSGKSTTLDAISGLSKITSGEVSVNYSDGEGGFGLCPQKNVLWDRLTVMEHIKVFNNLKSERDVDSNEQLSQLIEACDLVKKVNAWSRTLSGGQKRKLQLAMMFTGGSSICCVDEVSSGLDPISRRKIWDILLAERGKRTILLTTHFLDEADLLADHIGILSKGVLKAQGSSVELKHNLGSGYRIHVYNVPGSDSTVVPQFHGIPREDNYDETVYNVPDSAQAAAFVSRLEELGITEYRVSGPTIEDVFLKVAEEMGQSYVHGDDGPKGGKTEYQAPNLLSGRQIGMARQAWILFCKRATILRRNWLPYTAAFLIPVIAASLVTLSLKGYERPGCKGPETVRQGDIESLLSQLNLNLVIGPSNKLSSFSLPSSGGGSGGLDLSYFLNRTHFVDTLSEFNNYINTNFRNVTPGGFFLGDDSSPPTFAWRGDGDVSFAAIIQNSMDSLLTGVQISTQYQRFEIPWANSSADSLILIAYFGLALAAYPAFFSLYMTIERLRNIRALHYSNGVRSLPLWLAYVGFDFLIVIATTVLAIVICVAVSSEWYHIGYLFVVLFLYGLASTLLAYVISIFAKSQLAAFAFAAGGQAVGFLIYLIAYMSVLTYVPFDKIDRVLNIVHFVIAAIAPIGNVVRALFVALNLFSIVCRDKEVATYPGEITLYGGPILYLTLQSLLLFGVLLWRDSGPLLQKFRKDAKGEDPEIDVANDGDLGNELARMSASNDGLKVVHLTKSFGKFVAVQDITFGVARGEVFALLGPNGAGKSTTITLIRGDIQPSRNSGEIFVENIPVSKQRAAARAHLGVCPQFDAIDQMTVLEHLRFYARIRGVPDVEHNVREVIRAVGLTPYGDRMASDLSGGNKRKLSLGIALMGNPTVLLLDEPSSGMDAASKRVMWRTLAAIVPGRSLVLTTHSMEEADALANRAGIMAKTMLALGTTDDLRRRHGNAYHVHIVHKAAPHTSEAEMERMRDWVSTSLPDASIEQKTYHGQLRFSVPGLSSVATRGLDSRDSISIENNAERQISYDFGEKGPAVTAAPRLPQNLSSPAPLAATSGGINVSTLFTLLERNKDALGFEYYSVSQTTLDQVFLSIVGKHNVAEEGE
ncbi:hypothetical protein GX51_03051 [Blastomyces parvus]|uniref:ABC transporter domain-containing protein n=1 Tax=Blastomyces parvus TaxID=2060905 RepID=A0A2B7X8Y3_9EURO|nr:hypothetical protein GX51_03051 [Blastomyces parvus]